MAPTNLQLKQALAQLCKREGGVHVVARKLGCTPKTIERITKSVSNGFGNTAQIGPELHKRLDEIYPGWHLLGEKQ